MTAKLIRRVTAGASGSAADPDALLLLLDDWQVHLRARNISPATIDSCVRVGRALCDFLAENGLPGRARDLTRDHVETYLAAMFERKAHNRECKVRPATVAKHYRSLQQLFRWLVDDGEIERSPMERMRPPTVPEQPVPIVTDAHLEALLATCKGNTFENRRDLAVLRLFLDTGMRAGELAGLHVAFRQVTWPRRLHNCRPPCQDLNLAQAYMLSDHPGDGSEVFSLIRSSTLDPTD